MVIVVFGQTLRISGRNYKKQHSGQGSALITDGPYALVRNPMYLGTFLMGCGYVIILWPWWFLFIFVGIFYWRFRNLIISEENKLAQQFGKVYREYFRRVPSITPSFAKLMHLPQYLPLKWKWVKKELSVIFTWLTLVVLIKGFVDKANFFSIEYLQELMVLVIAFIIAFGIFLPILMKNGRAEKS